MSTTNTAAAPAAIDEKILSSIVTNGDLGKLNPDQKVAYYRNFCERLGLDPMSQPFSILRLNGKEILYCGRAGAQQLSKLHNVSHEIKAREVVSGCYVVTAQASTPDGRRTESIGAVPVDNLKGDSLCNAFMKAETKSKRRATLDLLGLGILDDDSEPTPAGSKPVEVKLPAEPEAPEPVAKPAEKPAPVAATPAQQPAGEPEATAEGKKLSTYKETLSGFVGIDEINEFIVNLREQPKDFREAILPAFNEKVAELNAIYNPATKVFEDAGLPVDAPAKRDLKWFQERIGKGVWMQGVAGAEPKQFTGRYVIADAKQAEGCFKAYQEQGLLFSDWVASPAKA